MTKKLVDDIIEGGIHRFLADGVHYRDLRDIQASTLEWSHWCRVWSEFAAAAGRRGEQALAAQNIRTAAGEFTRASIYYHYAQTFFYVDPAARHAAHDEKVAMFMRAAPLLDPPAERIEIPFDKTTLPAYLRRSPGQRKAPCVVLVGGLDTTKEDYIGVSDLCVARGLATIAFDGPGQGEMFYRMLWRPDFDRSIYAVLDYLQGRADIDMGRVGAIGRSLGGYYAPKAAATDKRVKAVVAWGAVYKMNEIKTKSPLTQQGFMTVSGAKTVEEAQRLFDSINLEGVARDIRCPLLIVHGGLDRTTPLENATRMAQEAGGRVETLIWDDSIHCCHDRSHIVRPAMADFLAKTL